MYLIPNELRQNLLAYIQANPSPNVPVGQCMLLLKGLSEAKTFGKPTAVAKPAEEDMAVPGGEEVKDEANG